MQRAPARGGRDSLTGTARVERPHVEDVNPLHFPQNLNTLETSGLLEIGGDGAGLGSLGEEVVLILDLCIDISTIPLLKKLWVLPWVNIPAKGFALVATVYLLAPSIHILALAPTSHPHEFADECD